MNINIYFGLVIRSRKRENVFWIAKVPFRFEMNIFSGFNRSIEMQKDARSELDMH